MREVEFKDYETYFSVNGKKYGVIYTFYADTAEVLQVEVQQVWDYETDLFVEHSPEAAKAAKAAAETVWHNWMFTFS